MASPLLEVKELDVFYGEAQALFGVGLHVEAGTLVAILGANGAGKSTLLKTIAGLIHPKRGEILFEGERINGRPPQSIVSMGISLVPEGRRIFTGLTVEENLKLGAFSPRARRQLKENLEVVYELFPVLKEKRNQRAGTLSGGQQQMLAIARAFMSRPRLMLLDEPSLGLSPLLVKAIFEMINELKGHGVTVVLVEQNVHQALKVADRVYILKNGSVVMEGQAKDLMRDEGILKAYIG